MDTCSCLIVNNITSTDFDIYINKSIIKVIQKYVSNSYKFAKCIGNTSYDC